MLCLPRARNGATTRTRHRGSTVHLLQAIATALDRFTTGALPTSTSTPQTGISPTSLIASASSPLSHFYKMKILNVAI